MVGKLVKEIMVAAKQGGPDPEGNARLFVACEKARKQSVKSDVIERAIKKGEGVSEGVSSIRSKQEIIFKKDRGRAGRCQLLK